MYSSRSFGAVDEKFYMLYCLHVVWKCCLHMELLNLQSFDSRLPRIQENEKGMRQIRYCFHRFCAQRLPHILWCNPNLLCSSSCTFWSRGEEGCRQTSQFWGEEWPSVWKFHAPKEPGLYSFPVCFQAGKWYVVRTSSYKLMIFFVVNSKRSLMFFSLCKTIVRQNCWWWWFQVFVWC